MNLPRIAITMGDAAGVGPEIVMKSLGHAEVYRLCKPLVIGDAERLREAGRICGSKLSVPERRRVHRLEADSEGSAVGTAFGGGGRGGVPVR